MSGLYVENTLYKIMKDLVKCKEKTRMTGNKNKWKNVKKV